MHSSVFAQQNIQQRLFFLMLGAPPSQTIARMTVTMNWEGIPTRQYNNLLSLDYNTFPSDYAGQQIYDHMIKNNLVITKDSSEFGTYNFIQQLKRY